MQLSQLKALTASFIQLHRYTDGDLEHMTATRQSLEAIHEDILVRHGVGCDRCQLRLRSIGFIVSSR